MRKVIILVTLIVLSTLMSFGCSSKSPPDILIHSVKANAVDSNKNGVFDDDDLFILYALLDKIYEDKILPYMQKAGVGNKTELGSPIATFKIRGNLTVTEYDLFMQNIAEYNKANSRIEATAQTIADRNIKPIVRHRKSEKALGSHVWGQIELASSIVIKYGGIKIPVGATDNKFARVVAVLSNKYISGRLIGYEETGVKVGNVSEAYVYVGKLFINEELVKRGYAVAVRDNSDKADILIKAEEEAKVKKKGLWKFYPQDDPFAEKSLY